MYIFVFKNFDAVALECCLVGMPVAEFETEEAYSDFFTVSCYVGANWIFIGATFSNGDGTDSWCSNFQPIPKNIITNPFNAYENCQNEKIANRLVIDKDKR